MKKLLITAACAFLLSAVLAACGSGGTDPTKVGTVTKAQSADATSSTKKNTGTTKATEAPLKDSYQVGDVVEVKGQKIIYTACGEYESSSPFTKPDDGNKFVFFEFYVENTGSGSISPSYFDFDGYADGYAVDQKYAFDGALSGSLSPGRWNVGRIYFEVPANAAEISAA